MDPLTEIIHKFENYTKKPERFLDTQDDISKEVRLLTKNLFDHVKLDEKRDIKSDALPELIIEEFDEEQIWQQLQLQNEGIWNDLIESVSWCVSNKNKLIFPIDQNVEKQIMEREESNEEDDAVEEEELGEGETEIEMDAKKKKVHFDEATISKESKSRKKSRPTVVDDKFFKLSEMEEFLMQEDKKEYTGQKKKKKDVEEDDGDSDSVDLFEAGSSEEEEEEEEDLKYGDFFDVPEGEQGFHDETEEENDDGEGSSLSEDDEAELISPITNKSTTSNAKEEPAVRSEFELRQERLKRKINAIESSMLGEKPWQMKGEVDATSRPVNSLLETVVDFELTARPAPVVTEETTLRLEDIIKQRIKDKVWDDVERKEKPVERPNEFRKKIILDQEKSKKSLAEVYEQDYLKEKQKLMGAEEETEEKKEHKEIKEAMKTLFAKLDALSNYHYTAKPAVPDVKIISNTPAITVEEVAPVAVSDAAMLAPEEIKAKQRGELMTKEERTETDKKRERRKKKLKQRLRQKESEKQQKLVDKLNPGMGNKYSKERAERTLDRLTKENRGIDKMDKMHDEKSLKSSKSFFAQLQDDATTLGKAKKNKSKKLPASKFKL